MSLSHHTYLACVTELLKVAGWFGNLAREGWHPSNLTPRQAMFGKAMTIGATGMMLPGAVADRDPTGQSRSKAERVGDLAGQTMGGLAGVGLANRAVGTLGLQAGRGSTAARVARFLPRNALMFGAPMAAGMLAGRVITAPARALRLRRQAQIPSHDDASSAADNVPVQTPIAQEGQQGQMR